MGDTPLAPKTDVAHPVVRTDVRASSARPIRDDAALESPPRLANAVSAPEAMLAQALEFSAQKMGLQDTQAVVNRLRQGDADACGYCLYSVARQVADRIGLLDQGVRAAYLLDYDATPEDVCFGRTGAGKPMIHMIIWTERKTAALHSLLAALDRGLVQAYAGLLRTSQPDEPAAAAFIDAQVIDDTEFESHIGYAGLLFSIHHRPIQIWER
jgi:hypothetical protein